ncbi:MAG: hypothetical protein ACRCV7_04380, partial [Culicoidibacterales bacterium]
YVVGVALATTAFGMFGIQPASVSARSEAWGGQYGSNETYGHMYDSARNHFSYTKRTSGSQRTTYAGAGGTSYSNSYGGSHQYWGFGWN